MIRWQGLKEEEMGNKYENGKDKIEEKGKTPERRNDKL